jgi:hypothetical protein
MGIRTTNEPALALCGRHPHNKNRESPMRGSLLDEANKNPIPGNNIGQLDLLQLACVPALLCANRRIKAKCQLLSVRLYDRKSPSWKSL